MAFPFAICEPSAVDHLASWEAIASHPLSCEPLAVFVRDEWRYDDNRHLLAHICDNMKIDWRGNEATFGSHMCDWPILFDILGIWESMKMGNLSIAETLGKSQHNTHINPFSTLLIWYSFKRRVDMASYEWIEGSK